MFYLFLNWRSLIEDTDTNTFRRLDEVSRTYKLILGDIFFNFKFFAFLLVTLLTSNFLLLNPLYKKAWIKSQQILLAVYNLEKKFKIIAYIFLPFLEISTYFFKNENQDVKMESTALKEKIKVNI